MFLNGYQAGCTSPVALQGTFGSADQIMQRDGRTALFFNNCDAPNASIEELGNRFRTYLESLPYPQVDVVTHSMGGLIVRSYLSGKQRERGVFQPPAEVKIRKAVFIAVPFFGSVLADAADDTQARQMVRGSQFLFDLATWNQGIDDLRGVDGIAITGNAGRLQPGQDDSTVALTSGSLEFVLPDRTRVVPYCHTAAAGVLCTLSTGIANWSSEEHLAARITLSFLNDTPEWRSIGTDVRDTASGGGVFVQLRDASDRVLPIQSATSNATVRASEIAWNDRLPKGEAVQFGLTTATGVVNVQTQAPRGGSHALIVATAGPSIAAVLPSAAAVTPRAVAPGMFVSIYGANLAASTEQAQSIDYPTTLAGTQVLVSNAPVRLHYASPQQVNAVVPGEASGLVRLTVRNSAGERTVNVLVEPSVPALFGAALNAVSGAAITREAPAHPGEYVAFYLTGLGATERRADGLDWALAAPSVTVGGKPCQVLYAGRAPGYVGLDQINCQIAADAATGDAAPVTVTSGKRTGVSTLQVR